MKITVNSLLVLALVLFWTDDAQAYIDPASGSYIFQLLLAGLLGALFALKLYWKAFKGFIARLLGRKSQDDDSAQA